MICVYVLVSLKDGKKYIGSTTDLYRRVKEHNRGESQATKNRRPLELFGYQKVNTIGEAAVLEKKFKRSHDSLLRQIKNGSFIIVHRKFS